ncbi:MAG TPA: hypothetical protein VL017_05920 [Devosia sp.]|nr:hypothetical protein [Devosia sp.]
MPDLFSNHAPGLESPAVHGFAISPSDGADLADVTRAVYVGGSGNLALTLLSGATLTFTGVAGGTLLPLRTKAVKATGTTATNLVGLL